MCAQWLWVLVDSRKGHSLGSMAGCMCKDLMQVLRHPKNCSFFNQNTELSLLCSRLDYKTESFHVSTILIQHMTERLKCYS